ncbi:hypothetical protein [Methylobacterium longum]|uniref:Uncharacterized protein n=1 Tax=Methylobacterium longum TaxID=767694 RepID=A0ABT8APE9_9HYPH|nr:hypothetical protein [Methylobacterium longum]MDN3571587.1 hypothetical protein [Methylobacterium longum]
MSDPEQINLYCQEASNIIAHAEAVAQSLRQNGACEGHNLMAAQCIVALKHLGQILEKRRRHVTFDAVPHTGDPPAPINRHWLFALSLRPRGKARASEART